MSQILFPAQYFSFLGPTRSLVFMGININRTYSRFYLPTLANIRALIPGKCHRVTIIKSPIKIDVTDKQMRPSSCLSLSSQQGGVKRTTKAGSKWGRTVSEDNHHLPDIRQCLSSSKVLCAINKRQWFRQTKPDFKVKAGRTQFTHHWQICTKVHCSSPAENMHTQKKKQFKYASMSLLPA